MSHTMFDIHLYPNMLVYLKSIYRYYIDIVQRSPIFLFTQSDMPRE